MTIHATCNRQVIKTHGEKSFFFDQSLLKIIKVTANQLPQYNNPALLSQVS